MTWHGRLAHAFRNMGSGAHATEVFMSDTDNQHVWAREQMAAALTGGLHGGELARFEVHVAQCAACSAAWEQLRNADRSMLEIGLDRMLRIRTAFSSTGLDVGDPEVVLRELAALQDAQIHIEVVTVVRELGWRMRELEREQLLRASALVTGEQAVIRELIERLKGERKGSPQ